MKKIIITTVIFLLSVAPFALAENKSLDDELLEEIDIMEAVLSRLMGNNIHGISLQDPGAWGFYLSGYGMIFNVSNLSGSRISMELTPPLEDTQSAVKYQIMKNNDRNDEGDIDKKEIIPEIKKTFAKVFSKYGPSLSGLKRDEKITVFLNLSGFYFMSPRQFSATLPMADIADFKKNKISNEELKKRIEYNEIESVDEDVSIFSNIIQTSLSRIKEDSGFGFQSNVKSIYIKGHGIVFMLDADVGIKSFRILNDLKDFDTKLKVISELGAANTKSSSGKGETRSMVVTGAKKDDFREYEDKLIQVISKYGHTLSTIKPDEYIEIAIRFNDTWMNRKFSKGVIKVKKSDIDNFQKGKINFDNFREKVDVIYY